ncbi:uncharacterized protein LOC117106552 [Anneissia japonica]|uniref:uncharacterized protein LOC117106552 n=1 Tax=Anneissia japonica TaxID=1529436 RepID=UPI00142555AE|nr:uncharacterized protein LOC117106552 [Anneissia japonica]
MAKEKKNLKMSDKYPDISDAYHYSELLLQDTCMALYGIIEQDIKLGKKELLKDSKFIQGRFYETMTYIMSRQEKDVDQVLLEYSIPRLKYIRGSTVVEPQIDVVLVKRNPDLVFVTAIVMTKPAEAYRPDVRSVRSDMARLAYMVLERIVRWGFYLWVGTLDELRNMELTKNFKELCAADGMVESQIVFRNDTLLLPRVGKPLPSSFTKTLLLNRLSGNFCLRLYRIEPEMTMWEERDDDVERLIEYYRNETLQSGYGLWGVGEQIRNIRRQLKKVRDYIDVCTKNNITLILNNFNTKNTT